MKGRFSPICGRPSPAGCVYLGVVLALGDRVGVKLNAGADFIGEHDETLQAAAEAVRDNDRDELRALNEMLPPPARFAEMAEVEGEDFDAVLERLYASIVGPHEAAHSSARLARRRENKLRAVEITRRAEQERGVSPTSEKRSTRCPGL